MIPEMILPIFMGGGCLSMLLRVQPTFWKGTRQRKGTVLDLVGDDLGWGQRLGKRIAAQQVGRGFRMWEHQGLRILRVAVAEDGDAGLGPGGFICSGRCTCWHMLRTPWTARGRRLV